VVTIPSEEPQMPVPLTRRRPHLIVPLAVAGLLGLAACSQLAVASSTGSTPTGSAAAGSAATGTADRDAFRSCLADNGVEVPEPPAGGPGADPNGRAGTSGGTAPTGAPGAGASPDGGPPDGAGHQGAGPAGGADRVPPGVDAQAWAAAQQACADLRPAAPTG
jgi:hypothetical protein